MDVDNALFATPIQTCHPKAEGMAVHPDDTEAHMSDAFYLKQLQQYANWRGLQETKIESCSRPEVLDLLAQKHK